MDKKQWVNQLDSEIMGWVYEVININFDTEMVQDSTELREMLDDYFDKIT